MDTRDTDIEHEAICGEAWAAWQAAEQVADGWWRHLIEIVLVLEEARIDAERKRAVYFLLEFEPDPEPD